MTPFVIPPPPPPFWQMPAGAQLRAGLGLSTVHADMDFETYSEAGYVWEPARNKWGALPGAAGNKKGLPIVGAAVYARHPSTEVLCMRYDLKDGVGSRAWLPGMPPPQPLFDWLAQGRLVEAFNSAFEYWIWNFVCTRRYGWPPLALESLRCAMAKGRAFALPGALAQVGGVLDIQYKKDPAGDALIKKFSVPQNPTAKRKSTRITFANDPHDGQRMVDYCGRDILAEAEVSSLVPDLSPDELQFWLLDQRINRRGVAVDVEALHNCVAIVDAAHVKYDAELYTLTGGVVARASELAQLQVWLAQTHGVCLRSMDEEAIDEALRDVWMPAPAKRALEIRQRVGSAAVKKVYAMRNQVTDAGRLHDLFTYHGARTGRTTGNGPQPTNLPKAGPDVIECDTCGGFSGEVHTAACPWCKAPHPAGVKAHAWDCRAVEWALRVIATRDLSTVEYCFGDALGAVSGCLRGIFVAAEGHDLICSDYSAIEAVVLAMVAGVQWRIDVFRTHGKIYEMSVSKIANIPFNELMRHAGYTDAELAASDWFTRKPAVKGSHHPLRQTVGKVAELASGYGGWIGAWINFDADDFMTEDEMKEAILAWRAASPEIVEFWGGQWRRQQIGGRAWVQELYGVEGMFVAAVLNPGREYFYRGFRFLYQGDRLYLTLLSGRSMVYHRPRLTLEDKWGRATQAISFEGYNTNPKNGPIGWIRMDTYGGRLTENIVQATARDIQWYGLVNLERAGYPIVLHVYDENIAEIPQGVGTIEEFERIMGEMPAWARDWPIKANGGWRGRRYRKD